MLLVFNKNVEPLNQFTQKNKKTTTTTTTTNKQTNKKSLFMGLLLEILSPFLTKYFPKKIFLLQIFLLLQSIRKRPFWINSTDNRQK